MKLPYKLRRIWWKVRDRLFTKMQGTFIVAANPVIYSSGVVVFNCLSFGLVKHGDREVIGMDPSKGALLSFFCKDLGKQVKLIKSMEPGDKVIVYGVVIRKLSPLNLYKTTKVIKVKKFSVIHKSIKSQMRPYYEYSLVDVNTRGVSRYSLQKEQRTPPPENQHPVDNTNGGKGEQGL